MTNILWFYKLLSILCFATTSSTSFTNTYCSTCLTNSSTRYHHHRRLKLHLMIFEAAIFVFSGWDYMYLSVLINWIHSLYLWCRIMITILTSSKTMFFSQFHSFFSTLSSNQAWWFGQLGFCLSWGHLLFQEWCFLFHRFIFIEIIHIENDLF